MKFFRQTLRHPGRIGRITPSSRFVARAMLQPIDFHAATTIIELGGGTGAITRHMLKRMRPSAQLFVFENNAVFAQHLRRLDDHRLHIIEGSAEDMTDHLREYGVLNANHVVSSLPMMLLPDPLVEKIIGQAHYLLKRGGHFVQMHHTTLMKQTYQKAFGNINVNFIPLSIPPAFVMVCKKTA